ncbi:MAG: carboxypeptidase regulatory-like domain-containing protein [Gemmatimonadales bacterium]
MRQRVGAAAILAASVLVSGVAAAQGVVVVGVAYDSLHGTPLRGAFVTLTGNNRPVATAISDSLGRFHFDGAAPGTYTLAVQAAVFDSVGLSGTTKRVNVTDGRDTIRIASPSFERLWRTACGDRPVAGDTGFAFGTVRSAATRRPVTGVVVSVRWLQIAFSGRANAIERPWIVDTRTDSAGDYRVCGLPSSDVLYATATGGSPSDTLVSSDEVELVPNGLRVDRLDLVLGDHGRGAGTTGVVTGTVVDDQGQPLGGARIHTRGFTEVRADGEGRFVISAVPSGSRQLDVSSIGLAPTAAKVDVYVGDTARAFVQLRKVTTLTPVQVKAASYRRIVVDGYEERKLHSMGYFEDSSAISRRATMSGAFETFPSVRVDHNQKTTRDVVILLPGTNGGFCLANIWVDGVSTDAEQLGNLQPDEVAAIEVYPRMLETPNQFIARSGDCGSVVVWTKRYFP